MLQVIVEIKIVRGFDIKSGEPLPVYHLFREGIIDKAPIKKRFLEFTVIGKNFERHRMPFCQLVKCYCNEFVSFFDDICLNDAPPALLLAIAITT